MNSKLQEQVLNQISPSEEKKDVVAEDANDELGLQNIDFSVLKEVDFIHHDQRIGSATMATSMFKDRLKKAGRKTPVKNIGIDELEDSKERLVIVTKEAEKNLKLRYTNVQILSVSNLLEADEYDAVVAHLK